ncbi:response regulator transcription factor [Saccharibacillus qingshengii]|uniref:response regulator transcription factor n=1 Tax=Saccharibacillus qingshengii TaxID=1763540 RepID=UPI001FEA3FCD|nr:response regulator transcription factor [Saccharibacillus qingshengii]
MEQVCRILIVDDEVLVRQGIKHYLDWEQYGFRIVGEASNGREGLEAIERVRPHIVLTDIVMPIMEGEEFTRLIKKNYPEIQVVVLSSYGEFDYVRSTFQNGVADYILKPKLETQELLRVLQNTARRIASIRYTGEGSGEGPDAETVLEKLASGYGADESASPAVLAELFPHDEFVLIGRLRTAVRAYAGGLRAGENGQPLAERLRQALSPGAPHAAALGPARVYGLPAAASGAAAGSEAALFGLGSGRRAALLAALRQYAAASSGGAPSAGPGAAEAGSEPVSGGSAPDAADAAHSPAAAGYAWAAGAAFASLGELSTAYRQLGELLETRFYFPERTLMLPEELPLPAEPLPAFDLRLFTEEIKREHFTEAFRDLRQYTARMAADYRSTPVGLKSFLGNIVFNLITLLGNMEYDASDLNEAKYGFFREIEEADSAPSAAALLEQFLGRAEAKIAEHAGQSGGANMKKLLAYIDEHYAEPLSLTGLGRHFHFNPSYLSSYFTSHNKEGFSEYLNKIRVSRAEELLREGEISISEISGRVGYSDPGYFTKVFKKQTGLSPSQYRRQYMIGR